jgi:hypothetical protein
MSQETCKEGQKIIQVNNADHREIINIDDGNHSEQFEGKPKM